MEWNKDMSAAPRDGTVVLGFRVGWHWPIPVEWTFMDGDDARWVDSTDGENGYRTVYPTHWVAITPLKA